MLRVPDGVCLPAAVPGGTPTAEDGDGGAMGGVTGGIGGASWDFFVSGARSRRPIRLSWVLATTPPGPAS